MANGGQCINPALLGGEPTVQISSKDLRRIGHGLPDLKAGATSGLVADIDYVQHTPDVTGAETRRRSGIVMRTELSSYIFSEGADGRTIRPEILDAIFATLGKDFEAVPAFLERISEVATQIADLVDKLPQDWLNEEALRSRFNTILIRPAPAGFAPQQRSRTRARQEGRVSGETACRKRLTAMMREHPENPVPKRDLRGMFSGVSGRGFERAFAGAVADSGAVAWSASGRRKKSFNRITSPL
jgi:hypothetical protein